MIDDIHKTTIFKANGIPSSQSTTLVSIQQKMSQLTGIKGLYIHVTTIFGCYG